MQSLPKMASIGKSLGVDTPPLVFLLDQDENSCGPNITDSQLATLPGLGVNYIGPWKVILSFCKYHYYCLIAATYCHVLRPISQRQGMV